MHPEQLAKPDTESAHQQAVFCWAALNVGKYPELKWLHHIPNGGTRGETEKGRAIYGGKLKAEGVKAGVLDLFLPVKREAYSGLYVEMKKPSERSKTGKGKGGVSDEQKEFSDFVLKQGFGVFVAYSWIEAVEVIEAYLNSN